MSIWQVNKLEESYPNTDSIVNFLKNYENNTSSYYSEDAFLPVNNFKKVEGVYLPTSLTKKLNKEEKDKIINNIQSAKFDFVIINGLCDINFYNHLKSDVLPLYYDKIFISDYNCTKSMFENNDGKYLIYKLKSYYKRLHKSITFLK